MQPVGKPPHKVFFWWKEQYGVILIPCFRNRRVKCDETRPECLRCTGTNRKCDGYEEDSSPPTSLVISPSAKLCPLDRDPHHDEVSMFGIFRDDFLSRLTGGIFTKVWSHDILQAAQTYPAVWHAGLAMAAAQKRSKIQGNEGNALESKTKYYSFSLLHYNASIKYLMEIVSRKDLSDGDRETLLVTSVLFLSLCALQNNTKDALVHAQSGTNLYYQWDMCDSEIEASRKGVLSIESLNILITTLECTYTGSVMHSIIPKKWDWTSRPLPNCSAIPFESLSAAYTEFIPLLSLIVEQGRNVGSESFFYSARDCCLSVWNHYQHEYGLWRGKFREFLMSWEPNDEELEGVLQLKMLVRVFDLVFGDISHPVEMHWDTCGPAFEEIVDIGEQMWELQNRTAEKYDEEAGAFTLLLFPAEGLYFVVANCRDADLRTRSIELLKKWKRQNGVWDSGTMATLCETLVLYEEEGASEDEWCKCIPGEFICYGHRSAWTKSVIGQEGEVVMTIRSVADMKNDLPGITYMLQSQQKLRLDNLN